MTRPLLLHENGGSKAGEGEGADAAAARETLWRRVAARLQELVDWDVLHLTWQQVEYEVLGMFDPAVWSKASQSPMKGLCAIELANVAAFWSKSGSGALKGSDGRPALGLAFGKRPARADVQSYQAYVLWR
eukprot:TRINITY_DN3790_c1_g1_i1.p3 TRINITY_DN3790_c1_g1~~TRINITY_DN3790_c1_g1_i1.p3  ORF type:complete len:143 (-),score=26.22 TRINITY_DN3790_c1_g1_i1:403-795(-)